jgi:hypothetical protein
MCWLWFADLGQGKQKEKVNNAVIFESANCGKGAVSVQYYSLNFFILRIYIACLPFSNSLIYAVIELCDVRAAKGGQNFFIVLVVNSSCGGDPLPRGCACAMRAGGVVTTRSPSSRWWLADGKVLSVSSWGPPGGCRATGAEAGLTEGGGQL